MMAQEILLLFGLGSHIFKDDASSSQSAPASLKFYHMSRQVPW